MFRIGLGAIVVVTALAGCTQTHIGASDDGALTAAQADGQSDAGSFAAGTVTARDGSMKDGLLGEDIGRNLSRRDRAEALAAEYRALEFSRPGRPVVWRNQDTGHYGEVVAGAGYAVNELDCRDYQHTVYIGGRAVTAKGTACRRVDRTWRLVS